MAVSEKLERRVRVRCRLWLRKTERQLPRTSYIASSDSAHNSSTSIDSAFAAGTPLSPRIVLSTMHSAFQPAGTPLSLFVVLRTVRPGPQALQPQYCVRGAS